MFDQPGIAEYLAKGPGQYRGFCPFCGPSRRNSRDQSLSIRVSDGAAVYNCWHCGEAGRVSNEDYSNLDASFLGRSDPFHTSFGRSVSRPTSRGIGNGSSTYSVASTLSACSGPPSISIPDSQGSSEYGRTPQTDAALTAQDEATTAVHSGKQNGHGASYNISASISPSLIQDKLLTATNLLDADHQAGNVEDWIATRAISKETVQSYGITASIRSFRTGRGLSCDIPYIKDGSVYSTKHRKIDAKDFLHTGKSDYPCGMQFLSEEGPLVLCEGEFDMLSLAEAGIKNALSLPAGASEHASPNTKFGFLTAIEPHIKDGRKIVLALDADSPGQTTAEELARRLGRWRCYKVDYPNGCKDSNDVLLKHGKDLLKKLVDQATPWPVSGIYEAASFMDKITTLYSGGMGRGVSTGYNELDDLYTIHPGYLSVVTGYPSGGKSNFIDQVMVNIALAKEWRFAICSFENRPDVHIGGLAAKLLKKPFFDGPTPRMSTKELERSVGWVNNHFYFLHHSSGDMASMEDILDRLVTCVLRYGIKGAVIDPYNYIARDKEQSETDWISGMLTKVQVFCKAYDVHVWFIAHPAKAQKNGDGSYRVPDGHSISGSAHWWNKADQGITIHRPNPREDNLTEVHVWKSRYQWLGKQGSCSLLYDTSTQSYHEEASSGYTSMIV